MISAAEKCGLKLNRQLRLGERRRWSGPKGNLCDKHCISLNSETNKGRTAYGDRIGLDGMNRYMMIGQI